ncbi:MAG TPA: DMT family transporter [Patescibacteria group bacterium]|nr:DMT family transporter [Patescibacteria group bacterium]
MDDLEGLLLGLTAALAWGLTDTVATVASRRAGSLRVTAGAQLTSVVVLAALMAGTGTRLPGDPALVALSLGCGVVAAVAYLTFFTALRHGPITVVSPVASTHGGLTVVLSVLLLGESLAPGQVLGVAVATGGVVLASVRFNGGLRAARPAGRGVAYAIGALVAFAGLTVVLAGPIRAAGWLPVLFLSRIANAGSLWTILGLSRLWRPAAPVRAGDRAAEVPAAERAIDRRAIGLILVVGLLDIGAFITFAIGLGIAPTWLVGISSSFGPVIAVTAGVLLFGERPRPVQWLGLGFVAASVLLIALG